MKSKNITTIIVEGTDGVGKSTLIQNLFKIYNYRYMCYHRGELSNLVYAKKFNRPFSATQVGLPFLHILLTCDKKELQTRIMSRDYSSHKALKDELSKIKDQDMFIELYRKMKQDYHMLMIDTTGLTPEQTANEVAKMIDDYVSRLEEDEEISEWNEQYKTACESLGLKFTVRGNQPYINNISFMSESTLQNGVYETFADKTYPDNLIYSYAYSTPTEDAEKKYDFAYIIYSKILRRTEIYDYFMEIAKHNKSCLIADNNYMPKSQHFTRMGRVFGDEFIKRLSEAKATVYCARDLAYLKLQTARLYEAILAKQIVFVDTQSDPDFEILPQIHGNDEQLLSLLYVNPTTICENYDEIVKLNLVDKIIENQTKFYQSLKNTVKGGKF